MKALKILLGVVAVVAVIAGGLAYYGISQLDGIVKRVVEDTGSEVVGSSVTLDKVAITLKEGRAEFHTLAVANPDGFSSNDLLNLGEIAVDIEPSSLTGDVIVIDEVLIKAPVLLAELKGLNQSNVQTLLNNIKANTQSSSTAPAETTTESGREVLLAVKRFTFTEGQINVVSDQFGSRELVLPSIVLQNLGSKEKGLTPEELTQAVIKPLLEQVREQLKKHLEGVAKDKAEEALKRKIKEKYGEEGEQQLNQLKSLLGK